MIKAGSRYITPSGAELVVTKGGDGTLTDGDVPLQEKDSSNGFADATTSADAMTINLGRRYQSDDEGVTVLVTKAGQCDLRYNGSPMEVQQPRKLPSSD